MRKIIQLLSLIIILLSAPKAMAQIISVCAGEDSVRLRLENYQYGKIMWMRSYDNENWEIINNESDTVYKFLPEESMYYRSQIIFGDCEPVYSATTLVQTLPKPYAGTDKTLTVGAGIYLSASSEPGTIGQWNILSGTEGVLANDTSANSFFYGSDTNYQLEWIMTNACGSRSDTLLIRYVETIYYDDIVYVDSTDQILSDSAEMVNGHYRIIFSDSTITVRDSTVLIGSMTNGFFEKVEHVQMAGDTFIMKTRPATLDDILIHGVLNATEVHYIDTVRHAPMPYILLDHIPTRAEMRIPEIRNGHYRIVEEGMLRDRDGLFDNMTVYDRNFHISYTFITANGGRYMRISPNFQCEYWESDGRHLKFGCENATLKFGEWGDVTIGGTFTIPLAKCDIPHTLAGIPMKACIKPYLSITGQCHFTYDHHSTYKFNALLIYHQNSENEYICNFHEESRTSSFEFSGEVEVKLGLTFHEDVAGGFFLFDTLGPYVDIALCASFSMCEASPYTAPKAFKLYPKIKVGAKASLRWKIPKLFKGLDLYYEHSFPPFIRWQNPYRIIQKHGDYQIFSEDNWLHQPIGVQVLTSWGKPSVHTKVHFVPELGCGEVENEWVETDLNGIAQTRWRLSMSGNNVQNLGVQVWGCSNHISGSPIRFQAWKGPCSMDNFRIFTHESVIGNSINVEPILENNAYPYNSYQWSLNGTPYSSTRPSITNPIYDTEYIFYVKNSNDCINSCTYILNSPDCQESTLAFVQYTVEDNSVTLETSGGHPPYSYRLDNSTWGFISNIFNNNKPQFTNLTPGEHLFQVQDQEHCIAEETITIGTGITVSFDPNCTDYSGNMPPQHLYYNAAMSLNPNTYVREGYTFIGWNTHIDGSGIAYADMATVTLTENTTLYAQWGNIVHRVILHPDGSTGSTLTYNVPCGDIFTLPPLTNQHPSCISFREWNTQSDGLGESYGYQAMIFLCAEMELFAIWDTIVAGTVYFHPNGAPQCETTQQVFHSCLRKALNPYNCEYEAHVFTGWNTMPNGSGSSYNDREIIELHSNLHLYAQWRTANICNITFNTNGGVGNFDPLTGYENTTVQLPITTPTKEGYHFTCWNTASNGSGTCYNPGSHIRISQNMTLYAQWDRIQYTVTFNANGGTGTMTPQTFYHDSLISLKPNTFTFSAIYLFANWNTHADGSGTSYHDQESIIVEDNLTLYAQWTSHPETTSCIVSTPNSNETIVDGRLTNVRDHEGNIYPVVQMNNGTCWLRTNVRASTSPTTGASLNRAAGYLYNWYAATDSGTTRGICPYGWHIPTFSEWQNNVLNNENLAYISGSGWVESSVPNSPGDCSNESRNYTNFSLMPTGQYFTDSGVSGIGTQATLWLGNGLTSYGYGPCIEFSYQNTFINSYSANPSCFCFAVRCIRN